MQFYSPTQTQCARLFANPPIRISLKDFIINVNLAMPTHYDVKDDIAFMEDCEAVWNLRAMQTLRI